MTSLHSLLNLRASAAAVGLLALSAPATAFQVQETNTVGPAEISDFALPGTPRSRPDPEPTIAPVTPPVAQPQTVATPTPAPATPTPTPTPSAATPSPVERAPAVARERTAPAPAATLPAPQDLEEALPPAPVTATPLPQAVPESAPAADIPAVADPAHVPEAGFPWLYLLLGGVIAGLGFLAWRKFGRIGARRPTESFAIAAPPAPPQPEPEPQPAAAPAAPAGGIGIVMRPWLELEFRPDRATATADGAGVQYEVIIRNTGNAPARNVRLAARMFNAGPDLDKEIAAFFARDVDDGGATPLTLLPRTEVRMQSTVSMPRTEMREIKVQGRSLFIPTVAFNLLYAWGRDKTGQTCSSHIVGREPEQPSQKMAPFRLDLGPRIYRQVGQRPSALARAV